ncbi:hypothetical protein C3L57_07025 [Veillonellaceae bacterium M2-8]|nr:hypothetical protein [Veillonellaceae bacterium M2-8]
MKTTIIEGNSYRQFINLPELNGIRIIDLREKRRYEHKLKRINQIKRLKRIARVRQTLMLIGFFFLFGTTGTLDLADATGADVDTVQMVIQLIIGLTAMFGSYKLRGNVHDR